MALEIKRGYGRDTIQDLVDKSPTAAQQPYEGWILQAQDACRLSGSFGWAVVFRRDRRQSLILLPRGLVVQLRSAGAFVPAPLPWLEASVEVQGVLQHVVLLRLESFLASVSPEVARTLAARL